jgi:hypothetical protein
MWEYTNEFLAWEIGVDYFSVASKWIHQTKFCYAIVISAAVLRANCLTRNDMIFHKQDWCAVKGVMRKCLGCR